MKGLLHILLDFLKFINSLEAKHYDVAVSDKFKAEFGHQENCCCDHKFAYSALQTPARARVSECLRLLLEDSSSLKLVQIMKPHE